MNGNKKAASGMMGTMKLQGDISVELSAMSQMASDCLMDATMVQASDLLDSHPAMLS